MKKILLFLFSIIIVLCIAFVSIFAININKSEHGFIVATMSQLIPVEKIRENKVNNLKESMESSNHDHVTIYYSNLNNNLLKLTTEALEESFNTNSLYLDNYNNPHDLIILNTHEELSRITNTDGIATEGFYNHSLNLSVVLIPQDKEALENQSPPVIWDFKKDIMHEYSHFVFWGKLNELNISDEKIPMWFIEGYAEYIGYQGLGYVFMDKEPYPLNELTTYEQWINHMKVDSHPIYVQSYLAVYTLIERYGDKVILNILEEMKSIDDFSKAFENITGIKIEDYIYYEDSYIK